MNIKSVSMVGALPPLKGNSYYCMGLAREMARNLYVDFIAFRKLYPEFLYPGGVTDTDTQFRIDESPALSIRRIITYYNPISWIKAGMAVKSDIVHLQWWSIPLAPIYLAILLVLKIRGKKIIFTIHNVFPHESNKLDKILTNSVLSFGDRFIVHTSDNRESLADNFKISRRYIEEVHMPVHDMYGNGDFNQTVIRNEFGIPSGAKLILSFGNIREYKGIDDLISALSIVSRSVPEVHLLIVGQPWVKWDRYDRMVSVLNLEKRVSLILRYVPMSDVRKYFLMSDLVALPYQRFDAQSGVGNIALAFGVPLVVSNIGGLPELVKDKRAIVEPNNVDSLANAITDILSDNELYDKLTEDAEILKQKYSWEVAVETTISIYRKTIENDEYDRMSA